MQFTGQQEAPRQSRSASRPAMLPSPTPPPPPTPFPLPSVSLGQQPTGLRPGSQDVASKSHPNVSAPGPLARARASGPYRLTAALTPGHCQATQRPARLSLESLEPSVNDKPSQTRPGEKRLEVYMDPHRRELLALWQQNLAQAMMEVAAMLRSRGRAVPRQMATAGGGDRRPQGGAVAPSAPGQGAGPLPGPALFTEGDAASPAAHSLTKGYHLAAILHKGSRTPERNEDEGKHRQLEFVSLQSGIKASSKKLCPCT
ncbi:uncharacterized protein LOC143441758 isoform X2 [Arvicanthis niloticus]|uniref:uncharacterized protein LOC143311985 isoform X2 n=1 Tax=Arvicanthis niloticus TaxID=61156 RepID=UPI00402BEEE3